MTPSTNLEARIHRALRSLPLPEAPRTLLPSMLAAIGRRQAWYLQPWLDWPRAWQALSLVGLVLAVGAATVLLPEAAAGVRLSRSTSGLAALVRDAGVAMRAALVLREALLEPVLVYVLGLVVVMGTAAAACGVALSRIVLDGRLR